MLCGNGSTAMHDESAFHDGAAGFDFVVDDLRNAETLEALYV